MLILFILNFMGCVWVDLNENFVRYVIYFIIFKICKFFLNMYGGCFCLFCVCFIFCFFEFLILEYIKLLLYIMCKSNCKREVI